MGKQNHVKRVLASNGTNPDLYLFQFHNDISKIHIPYYIYRFLYYIYMQINFFYLTLQTLIQSVSSTI